MTDKKKSSLILLSLSFKKKKKKKRKEFSLVLLSLGWIPLNGEFVAFDHLVDSLGDEVYLLFFYLLGGFPRVASLWLFTTWWIL